MRWLADTNLIRREHDAELLDRFLDHGRPATVAELFEGLSPRWALEALERLIDAGKVIEDASGRVVVIEARDLAG